MNFALNVHKNANDLRLMSCCYKTVELPEIQSGSAMQPGKINPVVPEMLVQVVYYMEGNDLTISRSVAAGDMEFNTNMPIIFACLFENLKFIRRAIQTLREKCLEGLVVKGVEDIMSLESGILALLQPKLGYATCREIAQYAAKENHSIINILIEHGYVTKEELEKLIK
jgi:aspartate ammonia-lyase